MNEMTRRISEGGRRMLRTSRILRMVGVSLALTSVALGAIAHQGFAANSRAPAPPRVSYAVKFVCGLEVPLPGQAGEPPVKPGNYATEVNIFNYHLDQTAQITKQVVVLVGPNTFKREPATASPQPVPPIHFPLPHQNATMDDCPAILRMANLPMNAFAIGYLVIQSTPDLDVDAVYTAETPSNSATGVGPTGISEQVVKVPARTLP